MNRGPTAILLVSCPDRRGLVFQIAEFVSWNNGNIVHADHHIDSQSGLFLMRVEWELDEFRIAPDEIAVRFAPIAEASNMQWQIRLSQRPQRIAIMVSKYSHCLYDLLLRNAAGELPGTIALVSSNHGDLEAIAYGFGSPFSYFPMPPPQRWRMATKQSNL